MNFPFNSPKKVFSVVKKSTAQTPFSVEATKTFFKRGDSKEE
jgi:hypothetical protein